MRRTDHYHSLELPIRNGNVVILMMLTKAWFRTKGTLTLCQY